MRLAKYKTKQNAGNSNIKVVKRNKTKMAIKHYAFFNYIKLIGI